MQPHNEYPRSRQAGLLVEQVGDEMVVYDQDRQTAHSLNRTAALVWQQCDGTASIVELAGRLGEALGTRADESVVHYALDRLSNAHLLEEAPVVPGGMSRREMLRRVTLTSAAIAIPAVLSIAAPTPAMADSGGGGGGGGNSLGGGYGGGGAGPATTPKTPTTTTTPPTTTTAPGNSGTSNKGGKGKTKP